MPKLDRSYSHKSEMSKTRKESGGSSFFFTSLASCFGIFKTGKSESEKTLKDGPEATMVAAGKHFSTAHKVRLI